MGPYLKPLFDKAFVDGLHSPELRPTADEWENALIKSIDLMQPCQNASCEMKWYVFGNSTKPKCPFCGTPYRGQLPMLNLYSKNPQGKFTTENTRLMVYHNQYIYKWHLSKWVIPNEKLAIEDKKPVGYFSFHNGSWVLVNQNIPDLEDIIEKKPVPIGQMLVLKDNQQILLSKEEGGRLCVIQIVDNQ